MVGKTRGGEAFQVNFCQREASQTAWKTSACCCCKASQWHLMSTSHQVATELHLAAAASDNSQLGSTLKLLLLAGRSPQQAATEQHHKRRKVFCGLCAW